MELRQRLPLAIGYLTQVSSFHEDLTVEEILDTAAKLRLPRNASRARWVDHVTRLSGIGRLLRQPYRTLSGGEKRRVALAEVLIGDPPFLFLDELTSGLDAYSDREMMLWLRELSHEHGKTIVLVTHATYHLHLCDRILMLHEGRQVFLGTYDELLESHQADSVADVFELYDKRGARSGEQGDEDGGGSVGSAAGTPPLRTERVAGNQCGETGSETANPTALKTAQPPSGVRQFTALLRRQLTLFIRDRGQLLIHLALVVTFPALVAVFAYQGLPQVRQLTLELEPNIVKTLAEQLVYLKQSFSVASLVSGIAMFQVVLLALIGANNGAREIAKEREVLLKELRVGLSPGAYVSTKFIQVFFLSAVQAFWMAWFVKSVCGFPGSLVTQFAILFATALAMSATCVAISAASKSAERASLLAIYLVGFQLPLSGAALALPDWLSAVCRPFIAAYWGWSGYLKTLSETRHYDIVKQSTATSIAPWDISMLVLTLHVAVALFLAWHFVERARKA